MDILREGCMFSEILENRKSLSGFLDAVFGFLRRKTDFYHIQKTKYEKTGFPPGIKEQIVLSSMQKYEQCEDTELTPHISDVVPPAAIEEVVIESSDMDTQNAITVSDYTDSQGLKKVMLESEKPGHFMENEYKNGAAFDSYCWSQTLRDVEVIIRINPEVKTSKHVKMDLKSTHISITTLVPNKMQILCGNTWDRYKHNDVLWTIGDGNLILSFDKSKEGWWDKLLTCEESIDIKKLDVSRPIEEFPEDTQRCIEKVETEEMLSQQDGDVKSNSMSKSEQMARLRQAWDADDSPFKGKKFDPSIMQFY